MSTASVDVGALAGMIRRLAYNAYGATLVGHPAPIVKTLGEAMESLRPGSLVVETSTVYRSDNDIDAVGYLERIAWEPADFGEDAEPWDEALEGRPHPTEKVYYIRTLNGREFRWKNASFIVVPSDIVT